MSRHRLVFLVLAVCIAAFAAAPPPATAALIRQNHKLTIQLSDNPVVAGDPVVIWGQLTGPGNGNRVVALWHRINPAPTFTPIQTTTTDANGFYAFFRSKGVVDSNRNWFTRALAVRSRTVHERVLALVNLSGPPAGTTLQTGPSNKVTFTGTVSPAQGGGTVLLQRQNAAGGTQWATIDHARVIGGKFTIVHTFRVPGDANIRALVQATPRHIASPSGVLSYQISQTQNPALTINASANPISAGQSVTLSGVLAGGVSQTVQLWAATSGKHLAQVAQAGTDGSGGYSFAQTPTANTIYQVRAGNKKSAQLFVGVRDVLTAGVSATTVTAGQSVTFTGSVSPDKTGHVIYLQRQNATGGNFHTVQTAVVGPGSSYSITRTLFDAGTKVFRIVIPGGPVNQGATSQSFTIVVSPAPASALPQSP